MIVQQANERLADGTGGAENANAKLGRAHSGVSSSEKRELSVRTSKNAQLIVLTLKRFNV
jgi:hypothetical protein